MPPRLDTNSGVRVARASRMISGEFSYQTLGTTRQSILARAPATSGALSPPGSTAPHRSALVSSWRT